MQSPLHVFGNDLQDNNNKNSRPQPTAADRSIKDEFPPREAVNQSLVAGPTPTSGKRRATSLTRADLAIESAPKFVAQSGPCRVYFQLSSTGRSLPPRVRSNSTCNLYWAAPAISDGGREPTTSEQLWVTVIASSLKTTDRV